MHLNIYLTYMFLCALLISWSLVFVYTYEYFTRTITNRLKFRYWTVVAFFSMLHIILAGIYLHTKIEALQTIRWLTFFVIDINIFEVFMHASHNNIKRTTEQRLRIIFPLLWIIRLIAPNPIIVSIFIYSILIYLARRSNYTHFTISFVLYLLSVLITTVLEPVGVASLAIITIYSTHIMLGIRKMYKKERIEEQIK